MSSPALPPADAPPPVLRSLAIAMRAIELVAVVVPAARRREWANEWTAELWYRAREMTRASVPEREVARELLRCGTGALRDAAELRIGAPDEWRADVRVVVGQLTRRPAGTVAALGVLGLAVGTLVPVLLLGRRVLDLAYAATADGLFTRTLILAVASGTALALLAAASRAALVLAFGTSRREPRSWRPRTTQALVLAGGAALPGATLALFAAVRLRATIDVSPASTVVAVIALSVLLLVLLVLLSRR
jgi:hypothetical protein